MCCLTFFPLWCSLLIIPVEPLYTNFTAWSRNWNVFSLNHFPRISPTDENSESFFSNPLNLVRLKSFQHPTMHTLLYVLQVKYFFIRLTSKSFFCWGGDQLQWCIIHTSLQLVPPPNKKILINNLRYQLKIRSENSNVSYFFCCIAVAVYKVK